MDVMCPGGWGLALGGAGDVWSKLLLYIEGNPVVCQKVFRVLILLHWLSIASLSLTFLNIMEQFLLEIIC